MLLDILYEIKEYSVGTVKKLPFTGPTKWDFYLQQQSPVGQWSNL
jgi:hypothetical protein